MKKRILSLALCFSMIFTLFNFSVITMKAVAANPVELDLSNGKIEIYHNGYKQGGGNLIPDSGRSYVITGQKKDDTPLNIYNTSANPVSYDIVLDGAIIEGNNWCTAIRLDNKSDGHEQSPQYLNVNLYIKGDVYVAAHNHPGIQADGKSQLTISAENGSAFTSKDAYGGACAISSNITLYNNLPSYAVMSVNGLPTTNINDAYTHKTFEIGFGSIPDDSEFAYTKINNDTEIKITGPGSLTGVSIAIPETIEGLPVTSIGDDAFSGSSFENITLPNSLNSIGDRAFSNSSISNIVIPDGVTHIGDYAFSDIWYLSSFTVPNSVTSMGEYVLSNCVSLIGVTLGTGLTAVPEGAFYRSSIESITLPENITSIEAKAFYKTRLTSVVIPDSITNIGDYAFAFAEYITSATISDSVTSMGNNVFYECRRLKNVTWGAGLTSIPENTFGASGIESIVIPEGVTNIGHRAFAGSSLKNVTFPNSLTNIDSYAFQACTYLESITFPEDVNISEFAFSNCSALENITIPDNIGSIVANSFDGTFYDEHKREAGILYIGKHLINVPERYSGSLVVKPGTLSIASKAFRYCTTITGVEMPYGIKVIRDSTFYNCPLLVSVELPSSVTIIEQYAFYDCKALANISIPEGVTYIGNAAFYRCSALKSLTLPDSITVIEKSTFSECTSLESINIPSSVMSIGGGAFYNCSSLVSISLPEGITAILDGTFGKCTSLKNVDIPSSVTSIGANVFNNCSALKNLVIPATVTSISIAAFPNIANSFLIFCYENSAAHSFAINRGFDYELIESHRLEKKENSSLFIDSYLKAIYPYSSYTAAEFLSDFNDTSHIKLYNGVGTEITGAALVGTGCELQLIYRDIVIDSAVVVVQGDLTGDGAQDASDLFLLNKAVNGHSTLTGAYYLAANADGIDGIDIGDYQMLENIVLGIAVCN